MLYELVGLNPKTFALFVTNYPNPFNPSTKIRYAISQTSFTTLTVYSILGDEVSTLINEKKLPAFMKLILMEQILQAEHIFIN